RPCAGAGSARGAVAGPLPPAQGHGTGALGLGHLHLSQLPAAVQVRASPADPDRADRAPALRDRGAPGPRALPLARRRDARTDAGAARCRLAQERARRKPARAGAAREGARRALQLPRAAARGRRRASVVRAPVRLPTRTAPPARPRRSRGPAGRWLRRALRADRLQDLAPEDGRAAGRRRAAVTVCAGRARSLAARLLTPGLLLRARRPQGPRAEERAGGGVGEGHRARGRRGHPCAGVRADAIPRRLLDLRLPDRLPGRGGLAPRLEARPLLALAPALAQEALEFAGQDVAGGHVLGRVLVALRSQLEPLHEGLDVRIAL